MSRQQLALILRTLSYFRPKKQSYTDKSDKQAGYFKPTDIYQDLISVRHKELISEKKDKFQSVL